MQIRCVLFTAMVAISLTGARTAADESSVAVPYKPNPNDCQIAPISEEAFATAMREVQILAATPRPWSGLESFDDPLDADQLAEEDLPVGIPADAETVAAVTALEQEYAACFNAGEFRRAAALMTGEGLLVVVSLASRFGVDPAIATPVPPPEDYRIPSVAVQDVRVFPDGRVGAVVDWGSERNFALYEQVEGRWRILDEISIY